MFLTERLVLRPFHPTDHDALLTLYNNHEAAPLFNGALPVPRYRSLEQMQSNIVDDADMFCVIELRDSSPDSKIIGFTSFEKNGDPRDQDVLYVIALHPDFWNKGYGTEITRSMVDYAFNSLNAHRISLGVFGENERAAAVYKKIGFIEEARQRKARWTNGTWQDTILMSILRDEWAALREDPKIVGGNLAISS